MGYKYGFLHVINRLHSPFVRGITSQGQMPFIGRSRASSPAGLEQILLRAWRVGQYICHVYYLGSLGEHLG